MTRQNASRFTHAPTFVPPIERWPDAGVYQLHLHLSVATRVRIGRLGLFTFPPGRYVYVGRAARGLRARVQRHVAGARTKRWHIDYLLARWEARIERVVLASENPEEECVASQHLATSGCVTVPRFGASDCKARCRTHLWRID